MRERRDVGATPHAASSRAAMRSVETARHMLAKVVTECTTSSRPIVGAVRPDPSDSEGAMQASNGLVQALLPAIIGGLIGAGVVSYFDRDDVAPAAGTRAPSAAADNSGGAANLDALRSDVAKLKANAPSQSHTMSDVGYHWANLWFAGEKKNWPLAMFYFEEARNHIRWTIQLRPVRKGPDGNDVN